MKTIVTKWFECTVRVDKMQEDGTGKKVTEQYVVDALTIPEAHKRITEEVAPFCCGEFEVTQIKLAQYKEVAFMEEGEPAGFYKVKIAYVTVDEKTAKEKHTNQLLLVEADNPKQAQENIDQIMKGSVTDYITKDAVSTKFLDVFTEEVTEIKPQGEGSCQKTTKTE